MLKKHGITNPALIQKRWHEHKSGHHNWHASLWAVLMYQAWSERGVQ
jgi:asparagine synthase (glutamine-hydrolysing)